MTKSLRALAGFLAGVLLLVPVDSLAQQFSLSGTVRDAVGVLPNATVTISGPAAGTTTTDNTGSYSFEGLAAGEYEVSITMPGFDPEVRTVTVAPGTAPVDVTLTVAAVSTALTVTDVVGRATSTKLPVADAQVPVQISSVPQELLLQRAANTMVEALQNVSGVQAFRWYGVYEYYTVRGFNQSDVMLLDGMRFEGNRYGTQTNNVESIEVLKGPSSIVYGGRAVGGAINVVRKKPEGTPAYDFMYRGGRFDTHQVAAGATGPMVRNLLLGRLGVSYEHSGGWRDAGADRLNVAPSLTWVLGENARVTIHQNFNRDRFDGDGGVPINITGLPGFRPDLRFSLPQDNALVEDSQTQILLNTNLSGAWEFRDSMLIQRTSDRYFVTEGVYGDPDNNQVFREPLDFHHTRRPWQNQADVVGRFDWGATRHTILAGYEYQEHNYRTDVTAGDDPDCRCGFWWLTIAPMNISTLEETNPPLDIDTVDRKTFNENRVHALYWQDQIQVHPQLHINIGGRWDDYKFHRERFFVSDPDDVFGIQDRNNDAYTYRAGLVYSPAADHELYFSTSTSFTPVFNVPPDGSELEPRTARNHEVGHRWLGWNGRVDTSLAVYYAVQNNLNFRDTVTTVIQIGEQRSKGVDLDLNADVGAGVALQLNYGYTQPRFTDADDFGLTGNLPRYVPKHTGNVWLRKEWGSGLNASIGMRYLGSQFANNSNSVRLGGYTVFSGALGYRAGSWDWTVNAANLFDRDRYFLPGHFSNIVFPGEPVNVSSTIRVRF